MPFPSEVSKIESKMNINKALDKVRINNGGTTIQQSAQYNQPTVGKVSHAGHEDSNVAIVWLKSCLLPYEICDYVGIHYYHVAANLALWPCG